MDTPRVANSFTAFGHGFVNFREGTGKARPKAHSMLIAQLEYRFPISAKFRYVRTMEMTSNPPPLQGRVVTAQTWSLLEEMEELTVVRVREEVLERDGPLSEPFQDPPETRRVFLDGCGVLPKGDEEFAALSPFPILCEKGVQEGEEWVCTEAVPNSPEPMDIEYRLHEFLEEGDDLVARIRSQGSGPNLEVEGSYAFSVSRGLLLRGQLRVKNRLPEGQTVSLLVDLQLHEG